MFGDKKADCPLWRAPCKEHGCRWYVQIQGVNPNTGVETNKWDCAIAWLPFLQIEAANQARETGASTDKVATEVRNFHAGMSAQNAVLHRQLKGQDDDGPSRSKQISQEAVVVEDDEVPT